MLADDTDDDANKPERPPNNCENKGLVASVLLRGVVVVVVVGDMEEETPDAAVAPAVFGGGS